MICCEQAADLIGLYVDDQLASEARRHLENHLLGCRDCAWETQTLQITRARLRDGIGEALASDAFRARAQSRLRADNPHLTAPDDAETAAAPAQYRLPMGF